MDDITFQRVNMEDYDRVISIRDGIYGGTDYLSALYQSMMSNYIGYAISHEEKLVAFMCVTFLDEGETMVTRGLRVSKEYEDRGLARKLNNFVLQQYVNNKKLKFLASTFDSRNVKMLNKIKTGKANLILQRDILFFTGKRTMLACLECQKEQPTVTVLQRKDMEALFRKKDTTSKLFPEERIIVNWVPYRILPENVDHFYNQYCYIVWSETSREKSEIIKLLTVGVGYPADVGIVYNIWIYGEIDQENFLSHIKEHMRKCTVLHKESVMFIIHHEGNYHNTSFIINVMEGYAKMSKTDMDFNTMYCTEEPL